jgi:hypothetical protein
MFLELKIPSVSKKASAIKKNRKMIRTQSRQPFLGQIKELGFPIRRNKKCINSRPRGRVLVGRPHKEPPTRGISMSPNTKTKSENSIIAIQKQVSLDLSLGKLVTLKFPPMH